VLFGIDQNEVVGGWSGRKEKFQVGITMRAQGDEVHDQKNGCTVVVDGWAIHHLRKHDNWNNIRARLFYTRE
jgi:hypothetical protein